MGRAPTEAPQAGSARAASEAAALPSGDPRPAPPLAGAAAAGVAAGAVAGAVAGGVADAPGDAAAIRAALHEVRARTLLIARGFSDDDLAAPALPILSPPVWDLGHIANFQEQWLVQRLAGRSELRPGSNDTYDAFRHPRMERPRLRLLDRGGALAYLDAALAESLRVLDALRLEAGDLTRDGFLHWMIVLHEAQHQETLLQSAQVRGPGRFQVPPPRPLSAPPAAPNAQADRAGASAAVPGGPPVAASRVASASASVAWIDVPAGPFVMGAAPGPGVYDNESPAHVRDVAAFQIARHPVTNGKYLEFLLAGGYGDDRWWSPAGRRWRDAEPHHAPLHWRRRDDGWMRVALTGVQPVRAVADEVLCHVGFYEAEAYAAYRGARLPTEAEWEKACRHDPATGRAGRNPWGDAPADARRANVDQLAFRPSRAGAYPGGASPLGVEQTVGDVWEWTATDFAPYPGFRAHPYREYSEVFFGSGQKVLRGGSWATRPACATGTFRNWDLPERRQIFAGIRLARDPDVPP